MIYPKIPIKGSIYYYYLFIYSNNKTIILYENFQTSYKQEWFDIDLITFSKFIIFS